MAKEKITSAKRVISRMDRQELQIVRKYLSEREKVLWDRERQAKIALQWEKIVALPLGSAVMVNTKGYAQFPRGTKLEIASFSARGRKCAHLKCLTDGKVYSFDRSAIHSYNVRPADEVDLTRPWDRMVIA